MLDERARFEIAALWSRKLQQDSAGLPQAERHRNLEPASAEFISALAAGVCAKRIVEVGGSSGISTIALASAARATAGLLISIEKEPLRQAEACENLSRLALADYVEFHLDDAASVLPQLAAVQFAFLDCEKEDYLRFFHLLPISRGGFVVADNVISHDLTEYTAHVRSCPDAESVTVPIGKGLEVTRLLKGSAPLHATA